MAKYVLLEFEDDEEVDKVIKAAQEGDLGRYVIEEGYAPHWAAIFGKLRAVYRKPTKFCDCKGDMRKRGFTRGRKWGWWVCNKCGKPTAAWGRGDHWFLALGRNLLPVSDGASEYRGDGVFGRYRKECPECHAPCVASVGHATTTVWCNACQKYV